MKNLYRLLSSDGEEYEFTTRKDINAQIEKGEAKWVGTDYDEETNTIVHYADRIF